MFSIHVDWQNYFEKGWENRGRSLLVESCKHKEGADYKGYCEKCGIYEYSAEPMMNYAYPLETTPEDSKIIEICKKTNCTVMYKDDDDTYSDYVEINFGSDPNDPLDYPEAPDPETITIIPPPETVTITTVESSIIFSSVIIISVAGLLVIVLISRKNKK